MRKTRTFHPPSRRGHLRLCAAGFLLLLAGACGDSAVNDDNDNDDDAGADPDARIGDAGPAGDGGPGTDGAPGPDASGDTQVTLSTYELEVGVNVDDPNGEGLMRWYGGLSTMPQGATVTNVTADTLELEENGTLRATTDVRLIGQGPLGALPAVQEQVWGVVALSAEELSTCQNSGPALHRGNLGQGELVVRLCGDSEQGRWCAEAVLDGQDLFRTCHSGVSALAKGWAEVWQNSQPPPDVYSDLSANVTVRDPFPFDPVEVTSLVVHGEGITETYVSAGPISGYPCYGSPPECFTLLYQPEGSIGDVLCPDPMGGMPPELYLTYEGTAAGQPFAGTAPAGQCMVMGP